MSIKNISSVISLSIIFILTQAARFLKANYITGSFGAYFTGLQCLVPLYGLYGGATGGPLLILAQKLTSCIFYGGSLFAVKALYIPMLCASLYLAGKHWAVRCFVPVSCIILFIIHPIGAAAWFYSLYWLIPLFVAIFAPHSLFFMMIGSTFTAHAVGSVIWLHLTPLTPEAYWLLMPMVIVERLLFASGMFGMHLLISSLTKSIETIVESCNYKIFAR